MKYRIADLALSLHCIALPLLPRGEVDYYCLLRRRALGKKRASLCSCVYYAGASSRTWKLAGRETWLQPHTSIRPTPSSGTSLLLCSNHHNSLSRCGGVLHTEDANRGRTEEERDHEGSEAEKLLARDNYPVVASMRAAELPVLSPEVSNSDLIRGICS